MLTCPDCGVTVDLKTVVKVMPNVICCPNCKCLVGVSR